MRKLEYLRIEKEQGDVRGKLLALGDGELTPEQTTEKAKLEVRFSELETKRLEYLDVEIREVERNADGEIKEQKNIMERARIGDYLTAAFENRELEGPSKEVNDSFGFPSAPGKVTIPWAVLLGAHIEERADTVSSVAKATDVGANQHPILSRLFNRSIVEFLQVTTVMAGVGDQVFAKVTAGGEADYKGKGASVDAQDFTLGFQKSQPLRFTSRYVWQVEDIARIQHYESSIRNDLTMQMADYISNNMINRNTNPVGFRPANGTAFFGANVLADNVPTLDAFSEAVLEAVDGLTAETYQEVKTLMNLAVYKKLFGTTSQVNQPESRYTQFGHFGAIRASNHLKQQTVASKTREPLIFFGNPQAGAANVVMWPGVDLIHDPYTGAASGQVALTALNLWDFEIVKAQWRVGYILSS